MFLSVSALAVSIFFAVNPNSFLLDYTFSITFVVIFWRLWIQEFLQACFAKESARFRALPPLLQRNDASLVCRFFQACLTLPATDVVSMGVVLNGSSAYKEYFPLIRIFAILITILNLLDMSQRRRVDWTLHLHHVGVCVGTAMICDLGIGGGIQSDPALTILAMLAPLDDVIYFLWPLAHMRRQREKEPMEAQEENDTLEKFPPPCLYAPGTLKTLNQWGFLHYVVLSRVGILTMLVVYMIRFFDEIEVVWRWLLPVGFLFFVSMDIGEIQILFSKGFLSGPRCTTKCSDEEQPDDTGDTEHTGSDTADCEMCRADKKEEINDARDHTNSSSSTKMWAAVAM